MAGSEHFFWFILAVILITGGHVLRAARWGLLLGRNNRHDLRLRFTALAIGYVVNAVIPLRVGELVRAVFFSVQTKSKLSHTIASIVVERAYDLAAISLLLFGCSLCPTLPMPGAPGMALAAGTLAIFIFATIHATHRFPTMRKILWRAANLFNERIRFMLLDFVFSLDEIEYTALRARRRFLAQTLLMWASYIASYIVIARALGLDFPAIFTVFYGDVFKPTLLEAFNTHPGLALVIMLYALTPCIAVIAYARLKHLAAFRIDALLWWLVDPLPGLTRRANDRFGEVSQYDAFLCRHFSGDESTALDFEIHAISDATIIRRLAGGSDAITAVVQIGNDMRLRKYAAGIAARKLEAQYHWLKQYDGQLPLVKIIGGDVSPQRVFYDMPYSITARDFYDFIHMNPPEHSWEILRDILETMRNFHEKTAANPATDATISHYISKKAGENMTLIRRAFPQIFSRAVVRVNGEDIPLSLLNDFTRESHLLPRFTQRATSAIHGDLTIENMIYDPSVAKRWFLIDPNSGNIFDSPLLDYAKILQSLHLGYEALNRNHPCHYSDAGIEFLLPHTRLYDSLFRSSSQWMTMHLGAESLREIRLHEIIHYLRLIPYKTRKSPQAGLLFFGCLCLLIKRYNEEFD